MATNRPLFRQVLGFVCLASSFLGGVFPAQATSETTKDPFEIRVDTQFENVMRNCAAPHRDNGWITEEYIDAYVRLHHLGWAHSIEVIDAGGANFFLELFFLFNI